MEIIEILNEDYLLRRIPLDKPNYFKPDGTICSYAFMPPKKEINEISVDIKRLTTYQDSIINELEFCLAQIKAEVPRINNLDVFHSPQEINYSHASIKGNFSKSVSRSLARNSIIIDEIGF